MYFTPFVESFVVKAFQEDFNIIIYLLMFVNPHTGFAMFLYYYAQHLSYFLCYFCFQVTYNITLGLICMP
jgi:hypothetical protein